MFHYFSHASLVTICPFQLHQQCLHKLQPLFSRVEKVLLISTIHCQLHKRSTCSYTTWLNTGCLKDKYCYKKISMYLEIDNRIHNNFLTNLLRYSDHLSCFCSETPLFYPDDNNQEMLRVLVIRTLIQKNQQQRNCCCSKIIQY